MNNIANNKFLLKTDCSFLIDNFIDKLKGNFPSHVVVLCESVEIFINNVSEISLFDDDKKIIILKDLDPDSLEAVSTVVTQPINDVIVLIQRQTISRTKAYTFIKGACSLVELKELNDSQCAVWVRTWLEELKLIFSEEIPSYIVTRVGADISSLHNEIKKVSAYFSDSDQRVLTQLKCDEFFAESTEAKFFVVVEGFFRKRFKEVFQDISYIDEYSYTKLISMLIRQVEKLYNVAIFKESGMSPEDIGTLVGMPKFIVTTKMFPYLSFYNKTKLIVLLDLFNKMDSDLRLTTYPKKLVLESYLLKAMKL
jgi:DNA polymerase III delta subunit